MISDLELLDCCILAYQLHAQTFLCAPDPYGEQMQRQTIKLATADDKERRYRFLSAMESSLSSQVAGAARAPEYASIKGYVPGTHPLGSKVSVAPIPAKYDRISPRFPGFVRPDRDDGAERWIKYGAPSTLTDTIGHWQTRAYPQTNICPPVAGVPRGWIPSALSPAQPLPNQPDRLYCFEGGTGMSANAPYFGVWSLMGFVLARPFPRPPAAPQCYDLVVAFRGSRSGHMSPHRMGTVKITGTDPNPDWKTNLQDDFVVASEIASIQPPPPDGVMI